MNDAPRSLNVEEHLQRIRDGDAESWAWLLENFSPFLELQASYRLGAELRRLYEPRDLVNEVWLVALQRLPQEEWAATDARRALMRYLSAILLHRVNDLVRKHIQRAGVFKDLAMRERRNGSDVLDGRADSSTSVLARAARSEVRRQISQQLNSLRPDEQVLLVLRFVEGLSIPAIAARLGENTSTVSMRYSRLAARLRDRLPPSLRLDTVEG